MAYTLTNNEFFLTAKTIVKGSEYPSDVSIQKNIYVNTFSLYDLSTGTSISVGDVSTIIRIYVNPLIPVNEISFSLIIDNVESLFEWSRPDVKIDGYNKEYDNCKNMNLPNNSFMLLRVNPKISGNVKVVVDSNSNLYLDAFKVNPELSKRKYRKIPISYKDYYGRNITSFVSNLPTYNYLYEVPTSYHKIFTVVNDYMQQYVDTYRYGASNNTDKLYNENFSILAPLSIGRILPDFFVVLKVNGVVDLTKSMSDIKIMKKLLKDGKFVKSFDLREDSKLGTYVRTIQDKSKKTNGELYVSYNPKQFNTYTGISIDKGNVTTLYESPYALKYKNQVQADNFYTLGFERNHLISDHIINFEYMFNDDDAEMFEINTYFGLYIKLNENNIPCCLLDGSICQIDGNIPNGLSFDASVEENSDILYCFSDDNNCYRINSSIYNFEKISNYNNRFGENIITSKVNKIFDSSNGSEKISYLSLQFNDIIEPGEHFKIIEKESDSSINIYELVFSNYKRYKNTGISRTVLNTAHSEDNTVNYNFYRISIYSKYRENTDSSIDIKNQVETISLALNSLITDFNAPFIVTYNDNRLGICSAKTNLEFERICNMCNTGLDSSMEDSTITYFNLNNIVDGSVLKLENCTTDNEYYYANNFEILGDRRIYVVDFKSTNNKNAYHLSIGDISKYKNYKKLLFLDSSTTYIIDNLINSDFSFIDLTKSMFLLNNDLLNEDKTNFYLPYSWNFGIASIFNIKDYNFNVLDGFSDISMPGEEKRKIGDKNHNIDFDVLEGDSSIIKNIPSEAFTSYISDTDSVPIYAQINVVKTANEKISIIDSSSSTGDASIDISVYYYDHPVELSMNKYLKFKYDRNVNTSMVSLTSPYNCKWSAVGTDAIANNTRLSYNNNFLYYDASSDGSGKMGTYSFMIPASVSTEYENRNNEIFSSLVGFAYVPELSSEGYKKYFDNMIDSNVDSSNSFRNAIYKGNMSIDNLLYTENNCKNKYSKVYYRGDNTLEFISSGVKFNIKFNSDTVVNLEKYNNYNGIFISTVGKNLYNDSDIELFIDEVNENLTVIWHQPVKTLRYGTYEEPEKYTFNEDIYVKRIPIEYDINKIYQINSKDGSVAIPTYSNIDSSLSSFSDVSLFTSSIDVNINDWNNYEKIIIILNKIKTKLESSSCNVNTLLGDKNSKFWQGYSINKDISKVNDTFNRLEKINKVNISYLVSKNKDNISNCKSHLTYQDLKDYINNCVIYIKTEKGLKYYDNKYANLYKVSVVDPIEETFIKTNRTTDIVRTKDSSDNVTSWLSTKYFVHPTYYEPEMIDMLAFEYNDTSVCDKFHKNYHMSNIRIKDIKNIDQMWFNKMSSDMNYCFNSNYTAFGLGIDVNNNYSILKSVWADNFFNKYSRDAIQDEYDRKNLAGETDFIINEISNSSDVSLYDYLPKIPKYLTSNTLDLADVKSDIKVKKEIFDSSSYDSSILYIYNKACDGSTLYSNCIESPNFKIS